MHGPSLPALQLLTAALALFPSQNAAAAAAAAAAARLAATAAAAALCWVPCSPRCQYTAVEKHPRSYCSSFFLLPPTSVKLPSAGAATAATPAAAATAAGAGSTRLLAKSPSLVLPMSSKQKGKKEAPKDSSSSSSRLPGFMRMTPDGCVLLQIHALPGAKDSSVSAFRCTDSELTIRIAAPPREGAANEELLDFVASALKVRKGKLSLETGHKSRSKVVRVSELSLEEVLERLQQEVG